MNNEKAHKVLSDRALQGKYGIALEDVSQVAFFLTHVFEVVRKPSKEEVGILKSYVEQSENRNMVNMAEIVIKNYEKVGENEVESYYR